MNCSSYAIFLVKRKAISFLLKEIFEYYFGCLNRLAEQQTQQHRDRDYVFYYSFLFCSNLRVIELPSEYHIIK